ncbi:signal transducer [Lyophyllum atratum]|nr:signal transducer [Lyophyllum atratum]
MEDRLCPGCRKPAVSEQGGLVVAFGQSFFHVDCFKCAKCGDQVTADTSLLLLSDGSPICTNCTYSCNVCHLPILDEAIMTGDDSYHAHCFKCKVCACRIDDLVFAKTSQGIYCMNCHNERMARIRNHVQKKAEREREKKAGGSGSTKSREREARKFHAENGPERQNPMKQSTLPIPNTSSDAIHDERRRSYDDGVRPLNVLFGIKGDPAQQPTDMPMTAPAASEGLTAPTSRRDKRRSINPVLTLSDLNSLSGTQASQPALSPRSLSFPGPISSNHPSTLLGGRDSPNATLSPLREQFHPRSPSSPRPTSNSSSHRSHSSQRSSSGLPYSEDLYQSQPSSPSRSTDHSQDQTIVPGSPVVNPNAGGPQGGDARLSAGPRELETLRKQRSFDDRQRPGSRPTSGTSLNQSRTRSRSVSPAYRADVPHSVESETEDTDPEGERNDQRSQAAESLPPAPPPKDEKNLSWTEESFGDIEPDSSMLLLDSSGSEESPVERTSRSTFIAPALPPIRLSMTSADFSEIFSSMGGFPSRKSLDRLAKIVEGGTGGALTPPPTAVNFDESVTPTLQDTASNASDSSHTPRLPSPPVGLKDSTIVESDNSVDTLNQSTTSVSTRFTLTEPESTSPTILRPDTSDLVTVRLQEAVTDARERGAQQLKMDRAFVEAILSTMEARRAEHQQLKSKFDGMKRTSKQYIEGLTVAQTEFDRELKARRDAEAEVTRLRVLLSGQVAKLTALSGDNRKEQLRQQLSKELHENLSGLELDLSNLKVERDMALAEVEELEATRSATSELPPSNLGRSLTKRLDNIKHQYKRDLVPLTKERESLQREIAELKAVRDVFLEETTVLNARNEELAQLSAAYSRRMEAVPEMSTNGYNDTSRARSFDQHRAQVQYQQQAFPLPTSLSSSTSGGSSTVHDDSTMDLRHLKVQKQENEHTPSKPKFMKWGSKAKEVSQTPALVDRKALEHNFQQLSILRFTRCDHCGDKMWGSQLRCTACSTSIHVRCVTHLQTSCIQQQYGNGQPEITPFPMPPSMFGRNLVEQVHADSKGEDRQVPVIVEKCIQAVEALALDYEGIYRKTGGTGQSKAITQLFERGDYTSFDLRDSDRFNDICSVTSVLKNYFRALPVPLLTYDLHEEFMAAVHLKDQATRHNSLLELVNKLPDEHYYTLRLLMLHLNRVRDRSEINKMNARNLGVVFGPTLMRSRDLSAEFHDMAGKALSIEWLVDHAPSIFNEHGHPELTGYNT